MKKVVVAGSRNYNNYEEAKKFITNCLSEEADKDIVFIVGSCRGADMLGERFAQEMGYKLESYPAEWSKYGKAAGPLRNKKMAEICDLVICFWDGKSRGSATMIDFARKLGKPVVIKYI